MKPAERYSKWMLSSALTVGVLGLVVFLGVPFASRTSQPTDQSQQQVSQSSFPTPGVAVSQTNSTAGWKTFQNDRYGYSFKYPRDIDIGELGEKSDQSQSQWQALYLRMPSFVVEIISHENMRKLTLDEYMKENLPHLTYRNKETLRLAGHESIQFDFQKPRYDGSGSFVPTRAVIISYGDQILEFWVESTSVSESEFPSLLTNSEQIARDYQVFGTVLSTLDFNMRAR